MTQARLFDMIDPSLDGLAHNGARGQHFVSAALTGTANRFKRPLHSTESLCPDGLAFQRSPAGLRVFLDRVRFSDEIGERKRTPVEQEI